MTAKDVLDEALASPKGIKLYFNDLGDCQALRFACYKVRSNERRIKKQVFPPDDPQYGTSIYDELTVRIKRHSLGPPSFAISGWNLIIARLVIPKTENL